MKKFYIKTLGCKVNQYESQVIRESFLRSRYIESRDIEEADIVVVNTCTVTSASDSKSLKSIRSGLKNKNRCVVATGCMVEAEDFDIGKLNGVDFIIKNKDKYRIPQIVANDMIDHGLSYSITSFAGHSRAFVKIQDGCDNRCSYCKVSVVRGKSRSRPLESIIDECSALIEKGYREIVLTGICLGAYGKDISKTANLGKLIKNICGIKGDWRVRLSSIEPKDVTGDLISQIASEEKICKHLHIPFQSGDDEILKKMNRPYTADSYARIAVMLREAIPDIALSTDIMVGFPGEEEANFKNTLDFIKEIRPMRLHVFGFSKRTGTPAYSYRGNVNNIIKKRRERVLLDAVKSFSAEFESMFTGKTAKVLVEDKRDRNGFLQGYTDKYIKVFIDGPDSAKSKLLTCQLTLTKQKVYGILLSYLD
jgi:threonylcarbamoyladenosine tRNA methylthiotransferase MtaB